LRAATRGQGKSSFPPFIIDKLRFEMNNDDEIAADEPRPQSVRQDYAFCDRMLWAIAAGLENAPVGVVSTPGIPTEPRPLVSSQRAMEDA
jgi:hypothetical protein